MTLLVIGAGDLGLRVAAAAARSGRRVFAMKRRPIPLPEGVEGLWADAAELYQRLPPERIDAVLYCLTPDRRDPESYRQTYVDRLQAVLDALDRPGPPPRLLFAGSTAVYPGEDGRELDEGSTFEAAELAALPFNGRILLEAESLLRRRAPGCALRIGGIYGPGREMLIRRLRTPGATVQREPALWTNRMHIEDVARAVLHLLALEQLPEQINLVDDTPCPQAEVLDGLSRMMGLPTLPAAALEPGASQGKRVSNARLRALGFRCRYPSWREGYAAMLAVPGA